MPIKPGDNKLGVRDTRTLEAYRDKIDPEGEGVSAAYAWQWGGTCCVCGAALGRDLCQLPLGLKPRGLSLGTKARNIRAAD